MIEKSIKKGSDFEFYKEEKELTVTYYFMFLGNRVSISRSVTNLYNQLLKATFREVDILKIPLIYGILEENGFKFKLVTYQKFKKEK